MSLNIGGAEKSLVNLLNMIDYNRYDVDLLLFQSKGPFLKQIPECVHRIHINEVDILFQSLSQTVQREYELKSLILALKRYVYTLKERLRWKQFDQIRIHRWIDYYSKWIPVHSKHYKVGIAYAGGETAYYLFDKVNCERKIYYFHSDYSKIDIDVAMEEKYVEKADLVVTISETCKQSLIELFPSCTDRISVIQNLSSPELIKKMAQESYPPEYVKKEREIILVSIGRLNNIKGYDLAIKAAAILVDRNIPIRWFVVGEGEERENLSKEIAKYNLDDRFHLIGLRENPYPYIENADILIQPSRFEGKSVVLDEAKILAKPCIVTNYNSVEDQIKDGIDGIIVSLTPEDLAKGIEQLINNPEQRERIHQHLISSPNKEVCNIELYMKKICGI